MLAHLFGLLAVSRNGQISVVTSIQAFKLGIIGKEINST